MNIMLIQISKNKKILLVINLELMKLMWTLALHNKLKSQKQIKNNKTQLKLLIQNKIFVLKTKNKTIEMKKKIK